MSTAAVDDDESMGDYWRAVKADRQEKRANNRQSSAGLLEAAGVKFTTNNGGAHLIVAGLGETIDFWPGTGLWIPRKQSQRKQYGVKSLIARCKPAGDSK